MQTNFVTFIRNAIAAAGCAARPVMPGSASRAAYRAREFVAGSGVIAYAVAGTAPFRWNMSMSSLADTARPGECGNAQTLSSKAGHTLLKNMTNSRNVPVSIVVSRFRYEMEPLRWAETPIRLSVASYRVGLSAKGFGGASGR